MQTPKFLLIENFSWLVRQLSVFVDPQFNYSSVGMPHKKGGARRIFRYDQHFQTYYQSASIKRTPPEVKVIFGNSEIYCDQWDVSHSEFSDTNLKEKFPKPSDVLDKFNKGTGSANHYNVMVTSRASFDSGTAKRYYVSCNCPDFETTFKEELIRYGYTNGMVPKGKGIKKLAPAICKHIYAVLMREYQDIIKAEAGPEESADISTTIDILNTDADDYYDKYNYDMQSAAKQATAPTPKTSTKAKKTDAEKKIEYEKAIRKSLKFFSNNMRDAVDSYHDTRQTNTAFKKYKFMIKKYFQGYVIVFTNPQLNPMRDRVREKEIVPIVTKTAKGMMPTADSLVVYTKYFSKDELMNMIKSESRPIQQNQMDYLTKHYKKYTLTESLEVSEVSSMRTLLMEIC